MSNPDEPKKPPPQSTVAWNPEDLPDFRTEPSAQDSEGDPPEPEKAPPRRSQPTLAFTPEDAADLQESTQAASEEETDDPEVDPLIGKLIRDKWRVIKRLGAGSFGTVYKVEDVMGGWIEALKVLSVDRLIGAEAENMRKRFLREAQIMKRLGKDSQHIVGLSTYEEDLEGGLIYFLMELVDGKPLADAIIDDGPFSVERTIKLALQTCDALNAAHEGPEPVVHRDLKLENLMLTVDRAGEEMVKVLDFGIAKIAERETDSKLTTVGTLGTPGYAAPEQLRAEEVDGRTDLFAFGVILYGLLTGKDPWLGLPAGESTDKIYELMVASDRAEVIPMSETGVDVPPAMQNVVLKLLRREPDDRYPNARELADALERVAAGSESVDAGSVRVLTDEPGVEVEIKAGRRTVAEGPTPCVANGLAAGTYKISVRDSRYERVETTITLSAGAMEDVTLVATPLSTGVAAKVSRSRGRLAAVAAVFLLAAGVVFVQPWGRTLELADLQARVSDGGITRARISAAGIEGTIALGPLSAPFKVSVGEDERPGVVEQLRAAGMDVDTSWEVARLVGMAAQAQAQMRYFGGDGDDVRGYAERVRALEPENGEARSLMLKVAERMAWEAEAAEQDGSPDVAEQLVRECLTLVPDHPRCIAAGGER